MTITMRKHLQKQLLGILASVGEAAGHAVRADSDTAYTLLCDCFAALTSVEEALSGLLGQASFGAYSPGLARAKEALEALNEAIAQGAPADAAALDECLSQLAQTLREEREVRLEVVFLPYKAAMWDSLESVWRAACDDPACDVYVVPIPYRELLPDGSLAAERCEDGLFPDYVPITHHTAYDLAARRPNIAYIHNCNDGHNHVTRVLPQYFTARLKKHVETLVYIPYYVTGMPSVWDQPMALRESAVDIAVVQHEEDRAQFDKMAPGKEVVALGSPKTDRILAFEARPPALPAGWQARLAGRQVLLLNTSINALMNEGERFLERLRDIFAAVARCGGTALLWRPHPLNEAAIASLRPDLYEGYRAAQGAFHQMGIGVIDDTPDVERAIALTSAYLGEHASSLSYMYALTGKPVLLLNFRADYAPDDALARRRISSAGMQTLTFREGAVWGPARTLAALCRVDPRTGEGELFPIPGQEGRGLYGDIAQMEGKLYLAPSKATEMTVYDPSSGSFAGIPLPHIREAGNSYHNLIRHGPHLFITPLCSPAILRLTPATGEIVEYTGWYELLREDIKDPDKFLFGQYCVVDGRLYLPFIQANRVLEFDLETGESTLHRVGEEGSGFFGLARDGENFWLSQFNEYSGAALPGDEAVLRWDPATGDCRVYRDFPAEFGGEESRLAMVYWCDGWLLVTPWRGDRLLRLVPESGALTALAPQLGDLSRREEWVDGSFINCGYAHRPDGDTLLFTLACDNSLVKLDTRTGEAQAAEMDFGVSEERYRLWIRPEAYRRDFLYREWGALSAGLFIEGLAAGYFPLHDAVQAGEYAGRVENGDGSCGAKIHRYVMKKAEA